MTPAYNVWRYVDSNFTDTNTWTENSTVSNSTFQSQAFYTDYTFTDTVTTPKKNLLIWVHAVCSVVGLLALCAVIFLSIKCKKAGSEEDMKASLTLNEGDKEINSLLEDN